MQLPVLVTFRNMPHSSDIEARIRDEANALENYYPRIMACRVVVDIPHRRHRFGNPFAIKIDITVPGAEITVNREPAIHADQKDIRGSKISKSGEVKLVHKQMDAAINEAFDTARRLLQERIRRERGDMKTHAIIPSARVISVFRRKGYGLLKTATGRQLSFRKESLVDSDFGRLKAGTRVTYVEEVGERGPEAVVIRIDGRQRLADRKIQSR